MFDVRANTLPVSTNPTAPTLAKSGTRSSALKSDDGVAADRKPVLVDGLGGAERVEREAANRRVSAGEVAARSRAGPGSFP